jgi:hypothetical protein
MAGSQSGAPLAAGAVPYVKGDLPFAWFVPGAVAPPMAFAGADRLLLAKLTFKEVLWSALAFGYV